MRTFDFASPQTVDAAKEALTIRGSRPIAGGTDIVTKLRRGQFHADRLVDISRLSELDFIEIPEDAGSHCRIGALCTMARICSSLGVRRVASAIGQAAGFVGCVQTRNRATIGGNIANASPAADSLPPLLVLDAQVTLCEKNGMRRLPLSRFLIGPGKTALRATEIITEVGFVAPAESARTAYVRFTRRRGMAVAVASAAGILALGEDGRITEARIALGAVAPVAIRCPAAERFLIGQVPGEAMFRESATLAASACMPIDDVRATAEYRRHAACVLTRRLLLGLADTCRLPRDASFR